MKYLKSFWLSLGDERLALIMAGALFMSFIQCIKNADLCHALMAIFLGIHLITVSWSKLGVK